MKQFRTAVWGVLVAALGLGSLAVSAQSGVFVPYEKDDANQRWRDIATNLFIVGDSYSFYDDKVAVVSYQPTAGQFTGRIEAYDLKPFFAYQFKLQGKPPLPVAGVPWVYDPLTLPEHWANEQLGYLGRWWQGVYTPAGVYSSGGNAYDSDYAYWKTKGFRETTGKGEELIHVFFGYLLFDFGLTDGAGDLYRNFTCNNSFHVLFKTSQHLPAVNDSAIRTVLVDPKQAPGWYLRPPRARSIGVFAEWEQGNTGTGDDRPTPGNLTLPEGTYPVELRLTEESFHETTAYSGSWATVMKADLTFTVVASPLPQLEVTRYTLVARSSASNDYAVATVAVRDTLGSPVAGATVTIAWSGSITATQTGTTGTAGTVVLSSPKKKNATSFTGRITNVATATSTGWSAAAGVPLSLTVPAL